jgi:hypothetical protein
MEEGAPESGSVQETGIGASGSRDSMGASGSEDLTEKNQLQHVSVVLPEKISDNPTLSNTT